MENAVEIKYYLHDVPVNETVGETYQKVYEEKENVEWYDFSKEAINEYVVDNSENTGLKASLNERHAEQHKWQEGIDLRLARDLYDSGQAYSIEELENWTLYYTYGKMALKRTFHLVNLFYDCQFYD